MDSAHKSGYFVFIILLINNWLIIKQYTYMLENWNIQFFSSYTDNIYIFFLIIYL